MPSTKRPAFLSELQLTHGPLAEFEAFFNRAYQAAAAYGVHLTFGTFEELLEVNLANQSSWRAIIPTFDPRYGDVAPDRAFCLLGYDRFGDVVATQACRLFEWPTSNFAAAAEDLTLFYKSPERDSRPGERCEVTAKAAADIGGRVAFPGGVWYRPDYRRGYLSLITPRIARAYAFSRWATDYTASLIQDSVVERGMVKRTGYPNIDWHVRTHNSPMGNITFAFVWMDADYVIDDIRRFETLLDAKADDRVQHDVLSKNS